MPWYILQQEHDMIKVANVDMENYAKSAGRILSTNRDIYIKAAVKILSCGYGSAHADVLIRQKVVDAIRRELFQKVQREGIVSAYTNWQCNSQTGIFRRRRRSLGMSDVPKRFLDVESLIPDLDSKIDEMTLQAKGIVLAEKIERIAESCVNREAEN